jgi:hypothetical protein
MGEYILANVMNGEDQFCITLYVCQAFSCVMGVE